jgi:hypothetical protein
MIRQEVTITEEETTMHLQSIGYSIKRIVES